MKPFLLLWACIVAPFALLYVVECLVRWLPRVAKDPAMELAFFEPEAGDLETVPAHYETLARTPSLRRVDAARRVC